MASERFRFGDNWRRFIANLSPEQIDEAVLGLQTAMGADRLDGRVFLDIGCGSGIHSLAAFRMGAREIVSFDFDLDSVACTQAMRERSGAPPNWRVLQGSVLDMAFLESAAPAADDVYSWGVLHHTGDMWRALDNASQRVVDGGRLFISIYNDQGRRSAMWKGVKRTYNKLPTPLRKGYVAAVMLPREALSLAAHSVRRKPLEYVHSWTEYRRNRGMSRWHDMVDWVGGYPFEVATPEEIFNFYRERGFLLQQMITCAGGLGCNQFVFEQVPSS